MHEFLVSCRIIINQYFFMTVLSCQILIEIGSTANPSNIFLNCYTSCWVFDSTNMKRVLEFLACCSNFSLGNFRWLASCFTHRCTTLRVEYDLYGAKALVTDARDILYKHFRSVRVSEMRIYLKFQKDIPKIRLFDAIGTSINLIFASPLWSVYVWIPGNIP